MNTYWKTFRTICFNAFISTVICTFKNYIVFFFFKEKYLCESLKLLRENEVGQLFLNCSEIGFYGSPPCQKEAKHI